MWHVSVKGGCRDDAMRALHGVGDASLGEWEEQGGAIHIRRRLSLQEQIRKGLSMQDLRGTHLEKERVAALLSAQPLAAPVIQWELGRALK